MSKIIIAGAGVGGLFLAQKLVQNGYEVHVFDYRDSMELAYDWHDDVSYDTFELSNISLEKLSFYRKKDWSFQMYGSDLFTKINIPDEKKDFSIQRRVLSETLLNEARGANFHFKEKVISPIVKDRMVIGIKTDKADYFADLIIDCCGVNTPLRSNLPLESLVQRENNVNDLFYVYRGFYKRDTSIIASNHTNKAYLRHLGRKGISWAIDGEEVDVLVGSLGGISQEEINLGITDLMKDNPIINNDIISDGKYIIPVRRPISKMIWNGYVALGDSAYMTIPMLGSGVRSTILSAKILSEVILNAEGNYKQENLWEYQVRVIKDILYTHYAVDVMKNWLINADLKYITFIAKNELVNAEEMALVATGKPLKLGLVDMLKKAKKGFSSPKLLLSLLGVLSKGEKVTRKALHIPKFYVQAKVEKWINGIEKIYR